MALQISLHPSQIQDLDLILSIGPKKINAISDAIEALKKTPLKPGDLKKTIQEILPDRIPDVESIVLQLLTLTNIRRKNDISVEELLDGINKSLVSQEKPWSSEKISKWNDLRSELKRLLSLPGFLYVVKALNLAYDYDKLLQDIKIITDVRPVYDEGAQKFVGAVVSHTLRIFFNTLEGQKSIRMTLDADDLRKLQDVSERALVKAEVAKKFMQEKGNIDTFVCGGKGE